MGDAVERAPPLEKVRLRKLTTTDGAVHVGVEPEYREGAAEPTRLQLGLAPEDVVRLGEQLSQLGEKLQSTNTDNRYSTARLRCAARRARDRVTS